MPTQREVLKIIGLAANAVVLTGCVSVPFFNFSESDSEPNEPPPNPFQSLDCRCRADPCFPLSIHFRPSPL
jgi:hypothetical protein